VLQVVTLEIVQPDAANFNIKGRTYISITAQRLVEIPIVFTRKPWSQLLNYLPSREIVLGQLGGLLQPLSL
jgi:hypothetical protein